MSVVSKYYRLCAGAGSANLAEMQKQKEHKNLW